MKDSNEPKAPAIPSVREDGTIDSNGVDLGQLNDWEPSENPHEGRFPDTDDDCAGECDYE